jgi:hypothetical protein
MQDSDQAMQNRYSIILMFFVTLLLAGCGSNDGRKTVSGTVSLDGKPLASGSVVFQCVEGKGNNAGGPVKDGQFSIPASHGVFPAKYAVAVQAFRPTGRKVHSESTGRDIDEVAQLQFRESGSITATVTAGGNNYFEFKLTSR